MLLSTPRDLSVKAADAIAAADTIVVIGYSIPPSDRVVRTMLRVMASDSGGASKTIVLVDVRSALVDTLRDVLPGATVVEAFTGSDQALPRFVATYCP